ncbi:hypothetical protein DPMN_050570 [Dreissena polymorpha]|uniref:G-protein coupled receptors family 1 profile domain-containing protein n=1 Tax=Dreissena polymorpha TaxID=45954 RepID=A0A9D4CIA5_DREPO|nr:hypothetical protein DPMN_050570 [Dreissena polymorpha]
MAVDRYLAISRPFYYKRYVTARTWKVVCVIASLSIGVYCLFPLMGLGDVRVEKLGDSLNCIWLDYVEHPPQRVFGMIYPLIGLLCILTIFLCNAIVIRELIRLGNRIVTVIPPLEGNNSAGTSGQDSSNTKVTPFEVAFAKMMASLSIVYLACGLPYHVSDSL